jgi:hypothetical protein
MRSTMLSRWSGSQQGQPRGRELPPLRCSWEEGTEAGAAGEGEETALLVGAARESKECIAMALTGAAGWNAFTEEPFPAGCSVGTQRCGALSWGGVTSTGAELVAFLGFILTTVTGALVSPPLGPVASGGVWVWLLGFSLSSGGNG